jgi:ribose-phosphate pyrophosphokinase
LLGKISMSAAGGGGCKWVVFSTQTYARLAAGLSAACGASQGELERKSFPDGEHYNRLLTPLNGRDVVLVGGTHTDADTLELYDLASGIVDAGAHRLILIIPYYGYSTMERAVKSGEVVTAKTRARLLSSLPQPGSGSQVVLLDLHVDSIAYYFEGSLRPWHLAGRPVILAAIRDLAGGAEDFVLASTDAGRAKLVESLANDLRVTASFVFKRRLDSGKTEVSAVSAQVQGKHVIIYDDSAWLFLLFYPLALGVAYISLSSFLLPT